MPNNLVDVFEAENGDFDLKSIKKVEGLEAVKQRNKQLLTMNFGEYFTNTSIGIPYFKILGQKNYDLNFLKNIFKVKLLELEVNQSILNIDLNMNDRELNIKYSALTDFGLVEVENINNV